MKLNKSTIRVWTPNKGNRYGHVSMGTGSQYISLRPKNNAKLTPILKEAPGEWHSLQDDLSALGTPSITIPLYTLNTSAIDVAFSQLKAKIVIWCVSRSYFTEQLDFLLYENSATLVLKLFKLAWTGNLSTSFPIEALLLIGAISNPLFMPIAAIYLSIKTFIPYPLLKPDQILPILQRAQNAESKNPDVILMKLLMKPPLIKYLDKTQLNDLLSLKKPPEYLNKHPLTVKIKESQSIDSAFIQNIVDLDSLPYFQVTELHLIGCQITDNLINDTFIYCIATLNLLDTLNLSHNRITYTGTLELSNGIKKLPRLRALNLSGNAIVCAPKWLLELRKRFSERRSLKEIIINSNFLDPECETLGLLYNTPERISLFRYALFTSHAQPSKSLLEPQSKEGITPMHWMICLACRKKTEHSMLFLEGMRLSGQKFLERYHLQASSIAGQARISMEQFDPVHFNRNNYYQASKRITEAQGTSLQKHVKRDHDKPNGIPFSKCYPGSKTHNCLTWSKRILKVISIKTKSAALPSTASKKGFLKCP